MQIERSLSKNKGFSLVELIIVIAIMAVLIGLLAPQYLRFVNRSKVVADMENAKTIADAINAQVMEGGSDGITIPSSGAGGAAVTGVPNLEKLPYSKYNKDWTWEITIVPQVGVSTIELGGKQIYPGDTSCEFYTDCYN